MYLPSGGGGGGVGGGVGAMGGVGTVRTIEESKLSATDSSFCHDDFVIVVCVLASSTGGSSSRSSVPIPNPLPVFNWLLWYQQLQKVVTHAHVYASVLLHKPLIL